MRITDDREVTDAVFPNKLRSVLMLTGNSFYTLCIRPNRSIGEEKGSDWRQFDCASILELGDCRLSFFREGWSISGRKQGALVVMDHKSKLIYAGLFWATHPLGLWIMCCKVIGLWGSRVLMLSKRSMDKFTYLPYQRGWCIVADRLGSDRLDSIPKASEKWKVQRSFRFGQEKFVPIMTKHEIYFCRNMLRSSNDGRQRNLQLMSPNSGGPFWIRWM